MSDLERQKQEINNIIWHINTNRKTCGDTYVLDDVLSSLINMSKRLENK